MKMQSFEDFWVTTLIFWGLVTSSVTWPLDSAWSLSYWWSLIYASILRRYGDSPINAAFHWDRELVSTRSGNWWSPSWASQTLEVNWRETKETKS